MNSWRHIYRGSFYVLIFIALLWVIELINVAMHHRLDQYGLYPRDTQSYAGLLLWSFIHGSPAHLVSNTFPLLLLSWFVALRGPLFFVRTLLFISLLAGAGIWLFGRESYHIGASGLVFGFFGFLVVRGLVERSLSAFVIGAITFFYFGGMLTGVLPGEEFVSWEAHLFGLIAGVIAASVLPVPGWKPARRESARFIK